MVDLEPFYQTLESLLTTHKIHLKAADVEAFIQAYARLRDTRQPLRLTSQLAWTYASYRMPATIAANLYVLKTLPSFQPRTVLDLGCGAGAASWAWLQNHRSLESVDVVEQESNLLSIAESMLTAVKPIGCEIHAHKAKLQDFSFTKAYDVVLLSYVVNELSREEALAVMAKALQHTKNYLVIVEPGHKPAFHQMMRLRDWVLDQGLLIHAPCSHTGRCPLALDDWCHFTVRFQRSLRLRQLKRASLGYEDEPFCYLIVSKSDHSVAGKRIVKQPQKMNAGIKLSLCAPERVAEERIVKKDPLYQSARKKCHGDLWPE